MEDLQPMLAKVDVHRDVLAYQNEMLEQIDAKLSMLLVAGPGGPGGGRPPDGAIVPSGSGRAFV
eukprot:11055740-Heterocapsa_arctica.AAC.1